MASWSDNFDRANNTSLGANWTEATGNSTITSNALAIAPTVTDVFNMYTGASFTGVDQYQKVTITWTNAATYPWLHFRGNSASTAGYLIVLKPTEGHLEWAQQGVGAIQLLTGLTLVSGNAYGITLSGTGTATVINVWVNPTGNTPTSATDWGGDTTPDHTFTTNPASPVDTGNGTFGGLGAYVDTGTTSFNDYFGGDIGGAEEGPPLTLRLDEPELGSGEFE